MTGRLWAMAAALFVLLAVSYTLSIGLRATRNASISGDEPFYLITAQSLLQDGNLDLRAQYRAESYREFFDHPAGLWTQSIPLVDGRVLSPHQPGLSVLIMPGFVAGGLRGVQVELLLLWAAAFALAFLLVERETSDARASWIITAVTGLTAPAFVYATEVYPEAAAGLCVVGAVLLLRARPAGARSGVALAALLSALAWLGMKYIPLGAVIAAWYLWSTDGKGRGAFIGASVMSAAAYLWFHLAAFGALTAYNSNTVYEGAATSTVLQSHLDFGDRVYRTWGLFIDRRFGIGRWAPVFLAVLPCLPLLARAGRAGALSASLIGAQVLIATFLSITMMGWWFPGRMLIVIFPLLPLLLTVAYLRAPRPVRVLGAAAAAYSLAITLVLLLAESRGDVTMTFDPFALASPVFELPGPLFPDYRWWSLETNVLTAAWLSLGTAALFTSSGSRSRARAVCSLVRARWNARGGVPAGPAIPASKGLPRE